VGCGRVRSVHRFFSGRKDNRIFEQVKLTMPYWLSAEKVFVHCSGDHAHVATMFKRSFIGSGIADGRAACETVLLIRNFLWYSRYDGI